MISCRSSSQDYKVSQFGDTFRNRNEALKSCFEKSQKRKTLPKASNYLSKLFNHIVSANPKTFQGFYNQERFCLSVVLNQEINAFAVPNSGEILFYSALIEHSKNDAEVAAILAHEMAHITMNHTQSFLERNKGKISEADKQKIAELTKDKLESGNKLAELSQAFRDSVDLKSMEDQEGFFETYNAFFSNPKSESQINRDAKKIALLINKAKRCLSSCQNLSKRLARAGLANFEYKTNAQKILSVQANYFSKEDIANGNEREADEVGFELYLRAGFEMTSFGMQFLRAERNYTNCLKSRGDYVANLTRQGAGQHPTKCWRVDNILTRYTSENAAALEPFYANEIFTLDQELDLAQVKEEIESFKSHDKNP